MRFRNEDFQGYGSKSLFDASVLGILEKIDIRSRKLSHSVQSPFSDTFVPLGLPNFRPIKVEVKNPPAFQTARLPTSRQKASNCVREWRDQAAYELCSRVSCM